MELDELKKSWNALNEQLQKEPIADEQQITELIAGYKANTRKSLGRLVVIQRFSIGIGTICLATLLLIWLLLPTFGFNEQLQEKIVPFSRIHCHQHSRRHVVGLENIPLEQEYTY